MTENVSGKVQQILNPALGKKPNLNEKQMKNLRMILQQVHTTQNKTFYYNIVSKQSNWGFSQNQRLLLLNVNQKSLGYISKIPHGYLPFERSEEIIANKQKQKLLISDVTNFKCIPLKGKISSMSIQWDDKEKKKHTWNFILGSSKIMNDWVVLINSVAANTYSHEKYDEMNKINSTSPLKKTQQNNSNQEQNNISNNNINQPLTGNISQNNLVQNHNNLSSFGNIKNQNINQINNNQDHQRIKKSNQNFPQFNNQSENNLGRIQNTNQQHVQQFSRTLINNQSRQNNISNENIGSESQIKRKPYIPKLGQSKKPTDEEIDFQINGVTKNIYTSQQIQNHTVTNQDFKNNQLGYNFSKKQSNKLIDMYKQKQNITENQSNLNSRIDPSQYQQAQSRQTQYVKASEGPQLDQNYYRTEIQNLQNNSGPGDFVEELKQFKQKNPKKFDLSNELSKKKFEQYHSPNNQNNYNYQDEYGVVNSQNSKFQPVQHKNSRQNLNKNVSAQKSFNYLNRNDLRGQQVNDDLNKADKNMNFSRNPTKKSGFGNTVESPQLIQEYDNLNRQRSRTKILGPSSGVQNNYDEYIDQKQAELYKPSTSFPESTKNLTKIRSDYLQRQSQIKDYRQHPESSKNTSKVLKNDSFSRDQSHSKQNFNSSENYNEKTDFVRSYSIDKKRQDSIKNLKKVNSKYSAKTNQKINYWNEIWLQSSNSNKRTQIHEQFVHRAQQIIKQIIQDLSFPPSYRRHQSIDVKDNIHTFSIDSILISLHFFENNESINSSNENISENAPVIYDHTTYEELKRQFYNYNLILGVTNNQGLIKVPLCCYFQYRGVLVLCKADIPSNYKQIEPYQYKNQFQALQNIIKVRFLFGTFNIYESTPYRGGQGKFIVLWNLNNLIPGIPNSLKNQSSYFRKQLLLQYDEILQDLQMSSQAHAFTLRHIIPELLQKLQSLQVQIVHSKDLMRQMHKVGLSLSYLPNLFQESNSTYLKRIFMSEIVACIFTQIIRSELNHAYSILPAQNLHNINQEALTDIIVDCVHVLINQFFSYSLKAENIWKIIVKQASKKYHIIVSKEEIIPGYLLSAIVSKNNLICNFKDKMFVKTKTFFVHQNSIPREILLDFKVHVRRYDMECICPTYSKCKQILEEQEQTAENYEHLVTILNLKSRAEFSNYFDPIVESLKVYLCNFIPFSEEKQYYNLDIYEHLYQQPVTTNSIKSSFLAIKWLIKNNQIERANQIFEIKFHQLSFWLGEYNPAITEFYDFFSMYYASIGEYEQSICLAKSSLINVHKILGQHALPVADKHYQLGNIYFKIGRKNQALKQYNKTKFVLQNHEKTTIPEYGIILLKISLLCLNFGELTDCIENAIEAERIFQNNGGNQNQEIQCFQILARVYQITKKSQDTANLVQACGKTFNLTQNPKIFERMLKIILLSKLTTLSSQQQKSFSQILSKLEEQTRNSYQQAFNFLHKKAEKGNIKKKIYLFLQNIVQLADEVNRRDLMRKHNSLSSTSGGQAEEMLNIFEAVGIMIGFNFMIGTMKDTYYE